MFNLKLKAASLAELPRAKTVPFRKRSSITVLDFEGLTVRAVQASGQPARIARAAEARLEIAPEKKDDAQALGTALKAVSDTLKLKTKEVIFTLPRGQVVLRPLQVPMVAEMAELASIINFQISKDLPFRIEDAIVDFKVLRAFELPRPADAPEIAAAEQRLEVLVGAVKRDVVEFYRTVCREAGLKLEGLGLRPVGHSFYARHTSELAADAALLMVSLRADESTLDIVDREKLVFSRVAAANFPENSEARSAFIQALQIEAVRSLHSHAGAPGQNPVRKILVVGASGLEQEVAESLGAKLALPAEVAKPGDAEPVCLAAAGACGLALSALEHGSLPLDFENPKKPAPPQNVKRTRILAAAAAVVVLAVVLTAIRFNLVKKRLAVKQAVQLELTDAEKKLPIYKKLKAQNKIVSSWQSEEQTWLDHIAYLSAILPGADQIYISAFTTTPQHVVRFSVQARTGELLAELDKQLRAAGYEVKPLSITPANDKHGYNFRTTVELSIPKKLKPDLSQVKAPPRPSDDTPPKTVTLAKRTGGRQ